jgi:nicotinamidase-related amidase
MRGNWIHLCVDMQRLFAEDTPWHVSWMSKISPAVVEVAGRHAERTIFTRFVPPSTAYQMPGAWRDFYARWEQMTLEHLDRCIVDVVPELQRFAPPARIFDKMTYSPWAAGRLHRVLQQEHVEMIAIAGGETDVCVLAAVLGAVDLGYHARVLKDAVCSGADLTHDASLELLGDRFSVQVEVVDTEAFLRGVAAHRS